MTRKQILAKLPATILITQDIIDKSKELDVMNCVGANSVKAIFDDTIDDDVCWGVDNGYVTDDEDECIHITTEERVNMMTITSPQYVTFIELKGRQ